MLDAVSDTPRQEATPYLTCAIIGLAGLFYGVTGPLLSNFVPLLVRQALGDHRTAIGFVMSIDNVLLLLLVPWSGAASDRASARGRGRLPIVLGGLILAAAGMALFPFSVSFGIAGVIAAIVVLYTGINTQRSPVQALLADLVPSRYRSLATGSVMFQMCVGAVVFLMLGRMLGMRTAFLVAAVTVLAIAAVFKVALREPPVSGAPAAEATLHSLVDAVLTTLRGELPGLRAVFVASFLVQLTFQTFTTWFSLHGTERFGVRPEDVTIGFIAWAMGGVLGALPGGVIGVRIGRGKAMLLGLGVMVASLVALHFVRTFTAVAALLALVSAAWTFPSVNAYPLFVEPVPPARRGVLAALFLLSMAFAGVIGDPLNGFLFDLFDSYRPMFLMMAAYAALGFVVVRRIPSPDLR
jgi:maltose/moltooligosaccharide transporter